MLFRSFNTPDESYHGLVYSTLPLPNFTLRIRLSLIRDIGAVIAPFNSWLLIQGLETLGVRIKAHSASARKIAEFLSHHPKVKYVGYAGLEDVANAKNHAKLLKYFNSPNASGLIHVELESEELAKSVASKLKLFSVVVNIGDSKSIITHPASTTHQQVPASDLAKYGLTPSVVRLSIGLEDVDDLIADLTNALS